MSTPAPHYGPSPFELVVSRLEGVTHTSRGVRALCPAHEGPESTPSLDVDRTDDGKVLICCRSAGCSVEEVVKALDLEMSDLFVRTSRPNPQPLSRASGPKHYPSADAVGPIPRQDLLMLLSTLREQSRGPPIRGVVFR